MTEDLTDVPIDELIPAMEETDASYKFDSRYSNGDSDVRIRGELRQEETTYSGRDIVVEDNPLTREATKVGIDHISYN